MNPTTIQKKRLTKIRLINWHYFTDETIEVNGSILFSGENASGKSTILDAIQLVLTTNSTRFNPAANERSKRDLRGYVRCKTGDEGNSYVRSQGAVISYVALEFYEESKNQYFVIGVKMDSPDLESEITKKWFSVEGRMDSLTFIVNSKPALDKEFTQSGKKIIFENQVGRARDSFRIRMGRLDDNFQNMIIKSMAFKPMDRVKDFINQFILPKSEIRTEVLQENIRNLRELQKLIEEVWSQIDQLHRILKKADEIEDTDRKILVVDIIMAIAKLENLKGQLRSVELKTAENKSVLSSMRTEFDQSEEALSLAQQQSSELAIAKASNECGRLIEKLENDLRDRNNEKVRKELEVQEFSAQLENIYQAAREEADLNVPLRVLMDHTVSVEERAASLEKIAQALQTRKGDLYIVNAEINHQIQLLGERIKDQESKISLLNKNQPVYDDNTTRLRDAINEEFSARKISSEARIFADLLEIEMPEWRNAVEGYLNTQRSNIIVEPDYYDIAAEVYNRMKSKIHSVGLVNVAKIIKEQSSETEGSLAEAVSSNNRFARAYANYLLGRVVRCDTVSELKKHSIAITKECMKYQGHVLSKIRDEVYRTPFIGRGAIKIQLTNAKQELDECVKKRTKLADQQASNDNSIRVIESCNFDSARSRIAASYALTEIEKQIGQLSVELKEAKDNPTFIELSMKYDAAELRIRQIQNDRDSLNKKIANKERDISDGEANISRLTLQITEAEAEKNIIVNGRLTEEEEALFRYQESLRTRNAGMIFDNYGPRKRTLENQREGFLGKMIEYQAKYKDGDFGTGVENLQLYREDLEKLEKADLLSYEDRLAKAQEECEEEFRENFLAKMRENIERAKQLFTNLNRSLSGIYYGNDSYKFELSANKNRQSLYEMITSEFNVAGQTLFSFTFDEKYHVEMEDLFSKLTDENLADSAVIDELTDYRSYLDYDIQVISKDGRMQRFSKTYGEKSGGETQTPYYVAIAASFLQLYSGRETVRVLMLDEAFNNMDEDRIESMMKFFKSQDFQVILAAPSQRMETIGEYVDSIYLAIHKGQVSTTEGYYL